MANEKRFWRGKMPMIVWDGRNNRPLVDFTGVGHITTSDEYTIRKLNEIGYIEIPLEATHPPELYEAIQPAGTPDVKGLPKGMTEQGAVKMQEQSKPIAGEDHDGPAVPKPTSKKSTQPNAPKKSSTPESKRSLKRRDKK
jgi:hypothetical protein